MNHRAPCWACVSPRALMAEGVFARALGCCGARQLIKLSFWIQIGVEQASLDFDTCRAKLHATRLTKLLSSQPLSSSTLCITSSWPCTFFLYHCLFLWLILSTVQPPPPHSVCRSMKAFLCALLYHSPPVCLYSIPSTPHACL